MRRLPPTAGTRWPLRASFGVAACPDSSLTKEGLPAQADAALYEAKKSGRDKVVVATHYSGG